MAATLLEMCQEAARQLGRQVPTSIVGSDFEQSRRMFAYANRALRMVGRRGPQEGWQALNGIHTVTTVAAQANYAMPTDFRRWIVRTHWDNTNYEPMYGPVSPAHWEALQRSQLATSSQFTRFFRQRGNEFLVYPTPSAAGETLTFEYQSKNLALDTDGTTTKPIFAADTDTPRVPDEVVQLFINMITLQRAGEAYLEEQNEAENALDLFKADDQAYAPMTIEGHQGIPLLGEFNIPDSGYG